MQTHSVSTKMRRIKCLLLLAWLVLPTTAQAYDPLKLPDKPLPQPQELVVSDKSRQREIPLRVYLPHETQPSAVVLFSHGLGGSREGAAYLGKHWSARGYVVVSLQHPGSDESVWREVPQRERMQAMRQAASVENYLARVRDVHVVLDQLESWHQEEKHLLHGRLDLTKVGMSGHSFGAQTTQAVSGQGLGLANRAGPLPRVQAAVIMSPAVPQRIPAKRAFGAVKLPWLLMTGTHDDSPIGSQTPESRREVYPALPPGDKYELVLDQAEHSAFTDRELPGDRLPRPPNHHRAILALSTAFWDTYLKQDPAARQWLKGRGPRQVLEKEDQWQAK